MITNQKKGSRLVPAAGIALAAVLAVGLIWLFATHIYVKGDLYSKKAEFLNLRGKDLTTGEFDAIQEKMPESVLYWDVPFQGSTYHESTSVLSVIGLSDEDVDTLRYFTELETIDARRCQDYAQIQELKSRYPDLAVIYEVPIDGVVYPWDAQEVTLTNLTEREVELMQYLPELTRVDAETCRSYAQLELLKNRYPGLEIACSVKIGDQAYTAETTEITVSGITDEEAELLQYLPNLTRVMLVDPAMTPENLFGLPGKYPDVDIEWTVDAFGTTLSGATEEVEIQGTTVDVDRLRTLVQYLPHVRQVFLKECIVDNEAMAAFREEVRQQYKVVWTVPCGDLVVRTDETTFAPVKHQIYYFFDEDAYNLRYCEDMEAIDLGRMSIHDLRFAEHMPKLKYLVLAYTQVSDLTPLEQCKSLAYLELDWTNVKDYTPLLECTALEDLNLGKTYGDVEPLTRMTWLKNLWIIDRDPATRLKLQEAFADTDTKLCLEASATNAGGWRELPNYLAMCDVLGMEYMSW